MLGYRSEVLLRPTIGVERLTFVERVEHLSPPSCMLSKRARAFLILPHIMLCRASCKSLGGSWK
eukprot:5546806-Amphidinium_carterae.1